jgi:small subunit ribosomal protein S20
MREMPVANEKIAADHARRRRGRGSSTRQLYEDACYHPAARSAGVFTRMANIKQQKKRVRTAARQRVENLRYRSTVKTLTRRLERAVRDGNADEVSTEHRELVRWLDRAVARGALHRNTAARKKAQAAKIVAGD